MRNKPKTPTTKTKKDRSTMMIVVLLLAASFGLTAAYLYSSPKNTEASYETRVASMDENEEDDISYMQVSIPGYSDEDYEKYTEEKTSYMKQYEDKNEEEKSEKEKLTITVPSYKQSDDDRTQGGAQTGTSSNPSIVNHYYTDSNGNKTYSPDKNGNTVYVIEYTNGQTLSDDYVQSLITSYLNSNYVITGEVPGGNGSDGSSSHIDLTGNQNTSSSGSNSGGASSNIDLSNGGNSNNTSPSTSIYSSESSPIANILDSSKVVTTKSDDYRDSITKEAPDDSIAISISGSVGQKNDGRVMVGSVGTSPYNIVSLEWHIKTISGKATLTDTENDFTKNIHLDDGSAAEVYVIATYNDGKIRTSKILTIAHKDYK